MQNVDEAGAPLPDERLPGQMFVSEMGENHSRNVLAAGVPS